MSFETFVICDRCGDSFHKTNDSDTRSWGVVECESMDPGRQSFLVFPGFGPPPEPEQQPERLRTERWHACPRCVVDLRAFFAVAAKTRVAQ